MVSLDTFDDNLCLWCCIAVYRGARSDQSTQAARGLAKSYFKLRMVPNNVPKTSLDQLDHVEKHLNEGLALADWLGIRVYEPEPQENGEILRHLRKNPSDKLKNKIPIGIYEGHALLIKDNKIPKLYACVNFQARSAKGS